MIYVKILLSIIYIGTCIGLFAILIDRIIAYKKEYKRYDLIIKLILPIVFIIILCIICLACIFVKYIVWQEL